MKMPAAFTMLFTRICLLMFSLIMVLQTDALTFYYRDFILLGYGIYQMLVIGMYWQAMKTPVVRILLCAVDLLITQMLVFLTGGLYSPFLICICIPVFTLHYMYGLKGLLGGIIGILVNFTSMILAFKHSSLFTAAAGRIKGDRLIAIGIGIILFYILPFVLLNRRTQAIHQLQNWEKRYNELDQMNNKLLLLFGMMGRFRFESDIAQIMGRLVVLCNDLFPIDGNCIFLIRDGEVEVYGNSTAEEKEYIYQLVIEQKQKNRQGNGKEYVFKEGELIIPLIRGNRTDGVLSFRGWSQNEITDRDIVLFSMIANMVCTYLENLEYVEMIRKKALPESCVMINQLESGKPVKGILDKRILSREAIFTNIKN